MRKDKYFLFFNFILFLILPWMANCATTTSVGNIPVGYASIEHAKVNVITRPNVNSYTILDEEISGKAKSHTILLLFETEDNASVLSTVISDQGIDYLDDLAKLAVSRAVNNSRNADGIFITKISEKSSSVLWFTSKREITVTGKPIKLKTRGPVGEDEFDRKYIDWAKRLQAKKAVNEKIRKAKLALPGSSSVKKSETITIGPETKKKKKK
jgi:hypothetical protein